MSNEESGFISDWAGCWIGLGKGGKDNPGAIMARSLVYSPNGSGRRDISD